MSYEIAICLFISCIYIISLGLFFLFSILVEGKSFSVHKRNKLLFTILFFITGLILIIIGIIGIIVLFIVVKKCTVIVITSFTFF